MEQKLNEFIEDSKVHRKVFDKNLQDVRNSVFNIELRMAEEKGMNLPERVAILEREAESARTFRDTMTGSITSLKWVLGIGFGFISSLLVGLIILVVREMLAK